MSNASKLIACIMIICSGTFAVGAYKVVASYVADGIIVRFFSYYFTIIKYKCYQLSVFFKLGS